MSTQRHIADRNYWRQFEPMFDSRLYGWNYRDRATFIQKGGTFLEVESFTAQALLDAIAQARTPQPQG